MNRTGRPAGIIKVVIGGRETASTPRVYLAFDCMITGHNLTVFGCGNIIIGQHNYVEGHYNVIVGTCKDIKGDENVHQARYQLGDQVPTLLIAYREHCKAKRLRGVTVDIEGVPRRVRGDGITSQHRLIGSTGGRECMGVLKHGSMPREFCRNPPNAPCRVPNDFKKNSKA